MIIVRGHALVAAVVLVLAMAGCAGDGGTTEAAEAAAQPTDEPTNDPTETATEPAEDAGIAAEEEIEELQVDEEEALAELQVEDEPLCGPAEEALIRQWLAQAQAEEMEGFRPYDPAGGDITNQALNGGAEDRSQHLRAANDLRSQARTLAEDCGFN